MPQQAGQLFRTFFSLKVVTIAVILTAVAGRVVQLLFFYNIRVDASYQVMATDNLLHGHGISTGEVLASDLSTVVYTPLTQWPPGYSLLLAPFYALFQHNYIAAGLALDCFSALALLFLLRRILRLFDLPLYLVNLFTLLVGFFIYYFYFIASSDAIAILFFTAGIYLALQLLKTAKPAGSHLTALVLSLFMAGLIKYLFIPVVFVVPLFLFAYGKRGQCKPLVNAGAILFLVLTVLLGSLLFYTKYRSGSVAYISAPQRGFYPEHLAGIYPFLMASIVKPDTPALLLNPSFKPFIFHLWQWLTLAFAVLLTIVFVLKIRLKPISSFTLTDLFFCLSFCVSFAITAELMLLSLLVAKEEILPGEFWTYVEEPRYYGLVYVLVQAGLFVFYHRFSTAKKKILSRVFALLLVLFLPEFFRGVLFDINRIRFWGKEEYSWQYEKRLQDYAEVMVQQAKRKYPATPLVVTGTAYYYNHRIRLNSHVPVLYNFQNSIMDDHLKTTSPVLLLVLIDKKWLSSYLPLLQKHHASAIGKFEQFLFYTIYVKPS